MEHEAVSDFQASGLDPDDIVFTRTADMRYMGQYHPVEVTLPGVPRTAYRGVVSSHKKCKKKLEKLVRINKNC